MDKLEFENKRKEELEKLKKPLEDFMNTWCCPHDTLIITQGSMELLSGEVVIPLEVKD